MRFHFQRCEPNSGCKNLKKVYTVCDEHDENVLSQGNTNKMK